MKKLLVISSVVAALATSSAFAKTEGSYAGVNLINTKATYSEKFSTNATPTALRGSSTSDSAYSVGLNYKYAVNSGGVFLAPGLFVEDNNLKVRNGVDNNSAQIKYRYGITADLGYDVTDKTAVYATTGYTGVNYKTNNSDASGLYGTKNGSQGDWMWGAGVKHDVADNTTLSLEYNTQNLKLKTATGGTIKYSGTLDTRIDVLKIGLAYRF
jgi:opacity protein-like surface antigen